MKTAIFELEQDLKQNAFCCQKSCDRCDFVFFSRAELNLFYSQEFECTAKAFLHSERFGRHAPHEFDDVTPFVRFMPRDEIFEDDWRTFFFYNAEFEMLCAECFENARALAQN